MVSANAELRAASRFLSLPPYSVALVEARRRVEAVLNIRPRSRRAPYELARVQWREGDFTGALSSLEKSLKIGEKPLPRLLQGIVYNALGRPHDALKSLEKAAEGRYSPGVELEIGHARNLFREPFDGLITLQQTLGHPANETIRNSYLGESQLGRGNTGIAAAHFKSSLDWFVGHGRREGPRTYMAAGIAERSLLSLGQTHSVSPISEGVAHGILTPAHVKALDRYRPK